MITAAQIRGARAMIGLTVDELARATALLPSVIDEAERAAGLIDGTVARILRDALESRGIVFIDSGMTEAGGQGIRLKSTADADDGIRPENLNATNDD